MKRLAPLLLCLALALPVGAQTEVTIGPSQDATLYEDAEGTLSNGAGGSLFVGRTQGAELRRALLAFDVAAAIPAGATIESAQLVVQVTRTIAGEVPVAVHRVTAAWGEGPADAGGQEGRGTAAAVGDATWLHTVFDTARWTTPGGDFAAAPSATGILGAAGAYTLGSAPQLVADVQAWLDAPASNAGWILIGEAAAGPTAKRLASREAAAAADRPALQVTYSGGGTAAERAPAQAVALLGAQPNPSAGRATVVFTLGAPAHVVLEVFDVLGRRQAVLVDGHRAVGPHRAEAGNLLPGLYLLRLRAGAEEDVGRMVRVR